MLVQLKHDAYLGVQHFIAIRVASDPIIQSHPVFGGSLTEPVHALQPSCRSIELHVVAQQGGTTSGVVSNSECIRENLEVTTNSNWSALSQVSLQPV
jgi:hypothetical protein